MLLEHNITSIPYINAGIKGSISSLGYRVSQRRTQLLSREFLGLSVVFTKDTALCYSQIDRGLLGKHVDPKSNSSVTQRTWIAYAWGILSIQ